MSLSLHLLFTEFIKHCLPERTPKCNMRVQKKNQNQNNFSDNDERLYCITAAALIKGNCETQTQSAPLPVILDELVKRGFQLDLLFFFLIIISEKEIVFVFFHNSTKQSISITKARWRTWQPYLHREGGATACNLSKNSRVRRSDVFEHN